MRYPRYQAETSSDAESRPKSGAKPTVGCGQCRTASALAPRPVKRPAIILILAIGILVAALVVGAQEAAQRFVILSFDSADIEVVIHAASEIVGFNYVLAPEIRGKVTVRTPTRIPQEEVFNVLLAILEVHGFTAIKTDGLYKIVRVESARERSVPTIVGRLPDPGPAGDEIITQIVPARFLSAADLSALLRPLISARGSLITYRETNLLFITDTASNIRRLLEIVRLVDVEGASAEVQVIPLKHADAHELAHILNQLYGHGRLREPAPPAVAPPPGPPTRSQVPPAEAPRPKGPPAVLAYPGGTVLIIQGRKPELESLRRLIAQLDVDLHAGRRIFIYLPEHVNAKDLAATLNAIYGRLASSLGTPGGPAPSTRTAPRVEGGARFIPDETTNAVIVVISPPNRPENEGARKEGERETAKASQHGTGDARVLGDRPVSTQPCQARATGPTGAPGSLGQAFVIIDATPADAQVFLDGRLLGPARQLIARAFPVKPGRHTVEVISPGYKPYHTEFAVERSLPTRLRVALQPE